MGYGSSSYPVYVGHQVTGAKSMQFPIPAAKKIWMVIKSGSVKDRAEFTCSIGFLAMANRMV